MKEGQKGSEEPRKRPRHATLMLMLRLMSLQMLLLHVRMYVGCKRVEEQGLLEDEFANQ